MKWTTQFKLMLQNNTKYRIILNKRPRRLLKSGCRDPAFIRDNTVIT